MSKPRGKYLWLDLETTGLDPQFELVLECAAVVTGADLAPVEALSFSMVVKPYGLADRRREANPFVRDMHTSNGLWDECAASRHRMGDLGTRILDLIDSVDWEYRDKPVLAGSSIHFDRSFLYEHLPDVVTRLHHRMLDVSSLKLMAGDLDMPRLPKAEAHRAMLDVLESIDHARRIYESFRKGPDASELLDLALKLCAFLREGPDASELSNLMLELYAFVRERPDVPEFLEVARKRYVAIREGK